MALLAAADTSSIASNVSCFVVFQAIIPSKEMAPLPLRAEFVGRVDKLSNPGVPSFKSLCRGPTLIATFVDDIVPTDFRLMLVDIKPINPEGGEPIFHRRNHSASVCLSVFSLR